MKVDAYRIERKIANLLERSADIPNIRKPGSGDFSESENVLVGHITPDTDLTPGDGKRLRAAGPSLHLDEQQGPFGPLLSMS